MIAKRFPRDQTAAFGRVIRSCQRRLLAEQAMYAYPRGGQTVTGPSIRLAEAVAQNWGNMDFGIVELDQRDGESTVMAYALDLETNVKQTRVFVVKHERDTKQGKKILTDARDNYEMTANQGARRLRACILGILPGDIMDAAIEECEKTLKGQTGEPIADRIRKMVVAFGTLSVTQEMLEKRLNHKIDVCIEQEIVDLTKIFRSIRDGYTVRDEWFDFGQVGSPTTGAAAAAPGTAAAALNDKAKQAKKEPAKEQPKQSAPKQENKPPAQTQPAPTPERDTESDDSRADQTNFENFSSGPGGAL